MDNLALQPFGPARQSAVSVADALAGYLTALLIGLLLALWVFPNWALTGGLPPGAPPKTDFAQHVLGQSYFFSQPWFPQPWSPGALGRFLVDRKLNAPQGANIAMTDSIPLLTVVSKLLRPVLPGFDQTITIYQAGAWVLQPVAAVFVLRSAGERRWLPAVAIALMAASMPTFLYRLWHAALSGHCFLLVMLGLHLRIVRGSAQALAWACALQVALLLVHPYLMLMASVLLLSAPLSMRLRRDALWLRTALASIVSSGATLLVGQILGYWGPSSDGGYGYYSMNLAEPFWPTFSSLFPGFPFAAVDATGGQAEGYQYLGAGLLGLLALSVAGWSDWREILRRHPGLALACAGLTLLAISNWVFLLHRLVLHAPLHSAWLGQMRGSGRLFWPVAYALMIASALVTLRRFPRAGSAILLAASLVQFADAQQLRRQDHASLSDPVAYSFDQPRLSAILQPHDRLTVLPTFPCNGKGTPPVMNLLWLAGRTRMTVNTMYMARDDEAKACLPTETIDQRPAAGEIRVILPNFDPLVAALPDHRDDCRVLDPYVLCTRNAEGLDGLRPYPARPVAMSQNLPIRTGLPVADTLMAGWTLPTRAKGAWSNAASSFLGASMVPEPAGAVRLRIRARSMPLPSWPRPGSTQRRVSVWAGPLHLADWEVGASLADFEVTVPTDWIKRRGMVMVELRTDALASLLDLGIAPDPRRFGIWLDSISFSPGSSTPGSSNPRSSTAGSLNPGN